MSRESGAPPGTSAMNVVALGVSDQCPGSDIAVVPYPATIDDYMDSEQQGVGNLTELVLAYQECCPTSKMVLLGYSQVCVIVYGLGRKKKRIGSIALALRYPLFTPRFHH